ncbi:MAG TPA: hypothetical protein VN879_16050 [Candidatus Acidoferrales bacterium]|nr:hypothetical protein [Candidatus Acidoferrales bacterium]
MITEYSLQKVNAEWQMVKTVRDAFGFGSKEVMNEMPDSWRKVLEDKRNSAKVES